jgi:hypothetical protein
MLTSCIGTHLPQDDSFAWKTAQHPETSGTHCQSINKNRLSFKPRTLAQRYLPYPVQHACDHIWYGVDKAFSKRRQNSSACGPSLRQVLHVITTHGLSQKIRKW